MTFRVMVAGEHVLMARDGSVLRMGFFRTCFVSAASGEMAGEAALAEVRDQLRSLALLNRADDPPRLSLETVEAISDSDVPAVPPGFVFFHSDDDGREQVPDIRRL